MLSRGSRYYVLSLVQVAVAQQIYDYVDQRIRRLDKDLRAFDAELTKERIRQGLRVSGSCVAHDCLCAKREQSIHRSRGIIRMLCRSACLSFTVKHPSLLHRYSHSSWRLSYVMLVMQEDDPNAAAAALEANFPETTKKNKTKKKGAQATAATPSLAGMLTFVFALHPHCVELPPKLQLGDKPFDSLF